MFDVFFLYGLFKIPSGNSLPKLNRRISEMFHVQIDNLKMIQRFFTKKLKTKTNFRKNTKRVKN